MVIKLEIRVVEQLGQSAPMRSRQVAHRLVGFLGVVTTEFGIGPQAPVTGSHGFRAVLQADRHLQAILVGLQGQHIGVHLGNDRLAAIDDLIEVDDRPVQVLTVNRGREGFVQQRQVAHLEPIALVLGIDDPLGDFRTAGAHVFDQQRSTAAHLVALLGEQGKKVGDFRKDPVQDAAGQGG
ncbi:MAG TPA: hypothetical protein PKD04_09950 [Rhodocyclaceae bacterium]|nr:hypothetical protein [Rhodocyclaceae bacterium]